MTTPPDLTKSGFQLAVSERLAAVGVPPEKHAVKLNEAKLWWTGAALFLFFAVAFAAVAAWMIATHRGGTSVAFIVALSVPDILCVLAALFCASQADGEATKAFLSTLLMFGKGLRRGSDDARSGVA